MGFADGRGDMKQPDVVIVCNDAGAAELLSALVYNNLDICRWHVMGNINSPAKTIFTRKGLEKFWMDADVIENIEQFLDATSPDYLFYGTGWQVKIEEPFVRWAKANAVTSVAFLEHWVNYRERFGYPSADWRRNLPDWVAVGDEPALKMARSLGFERLLYAKNYYFEEIRRQAKQYAACDCNICIGEGCEPFCLFVSEPISEGAKRLYGDSHYWGFSEIGAINALLESFGAISKKLAVKKVCLRLHPSENTDKYSELVRRYPDILSMQSPVEVDLMKSIISARFVIGFTSMALFNAYLVGKPVVSFIPSEKMKCVLPLPEKCQISTIEQFLALDFKAITESVAESYFCGGMELKDLFKFLQEAKNENSCHH